MAITNNDYLQQMKEIENKRLADQLNVAHQYGNSMQNMNQVNATQRAPVKGLLGTVQNAAQALVVVDPNKDPAMSMELDALVDLFTVRYGTAWVDKVTKPQDAFWRTATARLEKCGRVETYHPWVRIIPNKTKEDDGNN